MSAQIFFSQVSLLKLLVDLLKNFMSVLKDSEMKQFENGRNDFQNRRPNCNVDSFYAISFNHYFDL